MSEATCTACGRQIRGTGCPCGATWPTRRRVYGWLAAGLLSLPVAGFATYGAWLLAGRTVFERPYLGAEATATGAVLVALALWVVIGTLGIFTRGLSLANERRRGRRSAASSIPGLESAARTYGRLEGAVGQVPTAVLLSLVAVGGILWTVAYLAAGMLPRPVFVAVTILAWISVPVGIAADRSSESTPLYAVLSVVPFFAAIVAGGYLFGRSRGR